MTAACARVWPPHAGGLCGRDLRGDVSSHLVLEKHSAGQERDVFIGRVAPWGLACRGCPEPAFSDSELMGIRKTINAHRGQDSESNLQLEEVPHATEYLKQLCIHVLSPFKGNYQKGLRHTESCFSLRVKLVPHGRPRVCQAKHVGSVQAGREDCAGLCACPSLASREI